MINTNTSTTPTATPSFVYHYFLKDHLGNNRVVLHAVNNSPVIDQVNNYYPFGMEYGESAEDQGETTYQNYLFSGKEFDRKFQMNFYDFGARNHDIANDRWMSIDPLCEKYYSISPYAYCLNNPLKFVDPDGKAPGDIFGTIRNAAHDWGTYYNGASIVNRVEYGSKIYEVKMDGHLVGYSYSVAREGSAHSVATSSPMNSEKVVADIHSHGNDDIDRDDNHFSKKDTEDNDNSQINGFLASPNGLLQEYNATTKKTATVSSDLPSDPKDPDRRNSIKPTDQREEAKLWNSSKETTSLWIKQESDE